MVLNILKELGLGSISSSLKKYENKYRSSRWDVYEDILCLISEDYKGTYISACFKTNDPYAGGIDTSGQIWFYKSQYFFGLSEALLVLTKEISKAKADHSGFNYFRSISLNEEDAVAYSSHIKDIDISGMERWLDKAWKRKEKDCSIFEIFVGGTWVEADRLPWE